MFGKPRVLAPRAASGWPACCSGPGCIKNLCDFLLTDPIAEAGNDKIQVAFQACNASFF